MKNLKNALLLKQLHQLKALGYRYTSLLPYQEEEPTLSLPHDLDALAREAQNCHLCPLSQTRQRVLFAEGSVEADLMFVGDFPSHSDENTGRLFSAKTGDTLTKIIENIFGLKREEVYLCNVLKCRTVENMPPSSLEMHSCQNYLLEQIDAVSPKLIIALGETALHSLTGETRPWAETRGKIYQKKGYQIIATHHPLRLLRRPLLKKEIFHDLLIAKSLFSSMP